MRARTRLRLVALSLAVFCGAAAQALDSRAYIEKAAGLIENERHELARAYLAPALIDWRLHPSERSRAYYLNGYSFYAQGMPVSAALDYARALEFNTDNPMALLALGGLYMQGEGVESAAEVAVALFDKAAELGNDMALYFLGHAYLVGEGVGKDLAIARANLGACAGRGHTSCMLQLAQSFRAPLADEPDPATARKWYEEAHAAGESGALASLGFMYRNGEFGEPDPVQAARLFEQAANEGSGLAMLATGHAYLTGEGVPENPVTGLAWFERAAHAGEAEGFVWVGHMHQAGVGTRADLAQARTWFERGREAGSNGATERLAYLLLDEGTPAARAEAVELFGDLAGAGEPRWQNDFAWLLATSQDAAVRDGRRAVEHAKRAVAARRSAAYLDTLAAAHAELGEFELAIAIQSEAIGLAAGDDPRLQSELDRRLAAYQAAKPWRE